MPTAKNMAPAGKRIDQAPAPPVSGATRRIVLTGAIAALICAEAWSAPTLFALAEMARVPRQLAWLLPAVLDTYAVTSILFGNNVPKGHPAHRPAISNTRRALLITVSANGVYHLLTIAGSQIPSWASVALLIAVTGLPLYIADRLVHLYNLASGTSAADEAPTVQPAQAPTKAPTVQRQPPTAAPIRGADGADRVPTRAPIQVPTAVVVGADVGTRTADVIDMSSAGAAVRRPLTEWVKLALPYYEHHTETTGEPPTAPQLADRLADAGHGILKASRARDVRKATAELAAARPRAQAGRTAAASG